MTSNVLDPNSIKAIIKANVPHSVDELFPFIGVVKSLSRDDIKSDVVAGLTVAVILCLVVCGIAAWGRIVRGLSWTDMRKGNWELPEEEGWRTGGTATNMLPTARFESWQGNER